MRKSTMVAVLLAMALFTGPASATDRPGVVVQSGESWIFKLDQGQPVDARKVDGEARPATGEILVTLGGRNGTMMTVTNNTDKFYNYHAFMLRRPDETGKPTSVCTLMSNGRMAFENWPYVIPAMRLSDFTEVAENNMQCQ
jgi:hypothetical protein